MNYKPKVIHTLLGEEFYDKVEVAKFPQHILRYVNQKALKSIGLENLTEQQIIDHFGRFTPLNENLQFPLALRYHGHQFQQYNPQLGDGRGFLFAQVLDKDNRILDLGTKGSGTTPWSRGGDGRLTLKGAVREALATEYLTALGVYTSQTLSIIETGEQLQRNDEPSPTRSAVLVRLSHGHIRIGTFQRLAYEHNTQALIKLTEHCLKYYFNEDVPTDDKEKFLKLYRLTVKAQAKTVAQWTIAGFVHGVLNSDNINITGESFDYGPYRFLPYFDENFVAAYFDHSGLYRFGFQSNAVHWNLQRLAECFFSFFDSLEEFEKILKEFERNFFLEIENHFFKKLNLKKQSYQKNQEFIALTFQFLIETKCPYEAFFFENVGGRFRLNENIKGEQFKAMYKNWHSYCQEFEALNQRHLNIDFFSKSKPTTLLIEEIEAIWEAIDKKDDWSLFENKIKQIREMNLAYHELWKGNY